MVLVKSEGDPQKEYVLCLKMKYVQDFVDFLDLWKEMFESIYLNPQKVSFQLTIRRIIELGTQFYDFTNKVLNLEEFLHLDDFVVFSILDIFKERKIH